MTQIEWTDITWNPTVGCSLVSPGCKHCYAMKMAARLQAMGNATYAGLTQASVGGPVWTGEVRVAPEYTLLMPLRVRKPQMIFVNSMSDLFHESLASDDIAQIFGIMACAQRHTFQVLTKRPKRMHDLLNSAQFWEEVWSYAADYALHVEDKDSFFGAIRSDHLPNVWLGTSVEDEDRAAERIRWLLLTPARLRLLSCEPLLGPVSLTHVPIGMDEAGVLDALRGETWIEEWWDTEGRDRRRKVCTRLPGKIAWVIAGGESGRGARPMNPDWARTLRDECAAAGVPFFFKQWGEWREWQHGTPDTEVDADSDTAAAILASAHNPGWITRDGRCYARQADLPEDTPCRLMERVGKRAAGRELDGRTHDATPPHGGTRAHV